MTNPNLTRHPGAAAMLQRERDLPTVAGSTRICSASTEGQYDGAELRDYTGRKGSMRAHRLPSLIGGQRVYPRGA